MQSVYVNDTDGWHLVQSLYANDTDGWHLVQNAYVYDTDGWHLAYSAGDSLTETYSTPGTFTYTVPQGVRNLNFQYPTPTQINSFNVFNVYPGQEIKIKIGSIGDTSTIYVNTTTYVLPGFDTPVLSFAGNIDSWLNVDFSVATPTGTSVSSATTNEGAQAAAQAAGAIYTVNVQTNHGDLGSTVVMTPVPTGVITNPNSINVVYNSWSGRNTNRSLSPAFKKGNFYVANFAQNDDPQSSEGYYVFGFNLQQVLTVTVSPTAPFSNSSAITISPPAITANGVVNTLYTIGFTANGGVAPFTWHLDSGVGSIDPQTGVWTYTPTSTGTKTWTITVKDSLGNTHSTTYSANVTSQGTGGGTGGLALSPTTLASGAVGSSYSQTITANNGSGAINWSLVGTLPAGLLSSVGGTNNSVYTISGIPTAGGSSNITISATDSAATPATASQIYGIGIATSPIVVSDSGPTTANTNTSYTRTFTVSGGTAPYTWNYSPSSVPWASISPSGNVLTLTGTTPKTAGSNSITISVTDSNHATSTPVAYSVSYS